MTPVGIPAWTFETEHLQLYEAVGRFEVSRCSSLFDHYLLQHKVRSRRRRRFSIHKSCSLYHKDLPVSIYVYIPILLALKAATSMIIPCHLLLAILVQAPAPK